MQAVNTNKKLIDGYLQLFKNLSADDKLALISGLSDSLISDKKQEVISLKSITGDFLSEKSADVVIEDLKQLRKFHRDIEAF